MHFVVKTNHQHVVINWMIFRFRFENRIVISFAKNISLCIRMNYKVVFHKITWSKFMLIFPLFFLFWRWDENNLLRFWHLYIRWDLRDICTLLRLGDDATALSTLQMFRGCFTIHWPLLVAKILIFPKELTRKMQSEGPQPWISTLM